MTDSISSPDTQKHSPAQRLGELLQQARASKGLELRDVAEVTNVRKEYLAALDEGRYKDLPEDVYAKNFLRLYAQALGLNDQELLALYKQERHGIQESAPATVLPAPSENFASSQARRQPVPWASFNFGGFIPTLILVVAIVALAVWGFNRFLFPSSQLSQPPVVSENPEAAGANLNASSRAEPDSAEVDTAPSMAEQVSFTLTTNPEGAEVSIDNYPFPGTTPIENAPVTPGQNRILRITLEGYTPYEEAIDLSFNRNLNVELTPLPPEDLATSEADSPSASTNTVAGQGRIILNIDTASWLEVWQSSQRNQGERLVYKTAQPGESFEFALPVYLHVGNAGGVRLSVNGQDLGAMGSNGEVVSRAYTE